MKRLLLVVTVLAFSTLACEYTPSPPQVDSMTLNATYVQGATVTAGSTVTQGVTETPKPTSVPQDGDRLPATSPTPTQIVQGTVEGIIEVTPCGDAICETGFAETPAPPGIVVFEAGVYTPYGSQNVRGCGGMSCLIVGSVTAYQTVIIQGYVFDTFERLWLCQIAETDGIAQTCDKAVLYYDPSGALCAYGISFRDGKLCGSYKLGENK